MATETQEFIYYRHDTFVYRMPEPTQRFDADAIKAMELWNGHQWEPMTNVAEQLTVRTYGGRITKARADSQIEADQIEAAHDEAPTQLSGYAAKLFSLLDNDQRFLLYGTSTSGNHGHEGRPGERGGSAPSGGGGVDVNKTVHTKLKGSFDPGSSPPLTDTQKAELDTYYETDIHGKLLSQHKGDPGQAKADLAIVKQTSDKYPPAQAFRDGHPEDVDNGTLHLHTVPGKEKDEYELALTPERQELHDAIFRLYEAKAAAVENPQVVVLGGGPASGKSTMLDQQQPLSNAITVDPDEIRLLFPEYAELAKGGNPSLAAPRTHEEASALAKRIGKQLGKDHNLIIDGTGDKTSASMIKKIEGYRANGQPVIGRYSTSSVESAQGRADKRSGHAPFRSVPPRVLSKTHAGVSKVLPELIEKDAFDQVELWETETRDNPIKVISKTRGQPLVVHDQAAWDRFRAKAKG